jgi:hypothetical protein
VAGVAGIFTSPLLKNTRSVSARNKKMHVDEYFFSLAASTYAACCMSCGQREEQRDSSLRLPAAGRLRMTVGGVCNHRLQGVVRLAYAKLRPLVACNFDVETL